MSALLSNALRVLKFAWLTVLSPWRFFQSIRHSMTAASATTLIVCIMSLNIIWGYPWIGMFAAMIALMLVGWIANWMTRPRLRVGFSLPISSPAGEAFMVTTHVENVGRLPAMDLVLGFHPSRASRRARRALLARRRGFQPLSPNRHLRIIQPHEHVTLLSSLRCDSRGVHELPEVVIDSFFPFCMFRNTQRIATDTRIAITPKLLTGDEDSFAGETLLALGGWSRDLLAGEDVDYTGSREYQVGMPVRRWDFSSWARLGRPIVREFESQSVQSVTLVVDAGSLPGARGRKANDAFERLLSVAATAVGDLTQKLVRLRLYVSSEDPTVITGHDAARSTRGDHESLLIRLAAASRVADQDSDVRLSSVLEHLGRTPVLILTLRSQGDPWKRTPASVSVLRVDVAHADVRTQATPRQRTSQTAPAMVEGN